ncbi:MAG: alpha/beta hydrolase [Rubrivivax sp.]|nr:MAG: alpha/beta hydrolase [Rubrivivax sp.]
MTPFRFGPAHRQLFGIYHPATGRRQTSLAVLLCNPFGQEAVRLHRFYKVLAERLARTGIHVLRFDYFGTGDAAGDDEQGDLAGWCQDLLTAHQELQQRAMSSQTAWLGARLGATLAAMASVQAPRTPDRLVLWEPITDGAAYLRELAEGHARATADDYRKPAAATPAPIKDEAIGFGVAATLIEQLRQLAPPAIQAARAADVLTVTSPGVPAVPNMPGRHADLQVAFDWTSEEALNTALVPSTALQMLAAQFEETPA